MTTAPDVLSIENLTITVPPRRSAGPDAKPLVLVDDVSLRVGRSERVALVGESGSGKSMTAKSILRLDESVTLSGRIMLDGHDVLAAGDTDLRGLRGGVASMVFQDPMTALNPVLTIGDQVAEPLRIRGVGRREARERAVEMLDRLGVPDARARLRAYPHEFSGGMRQRVVMAAALISRPALLIADEPTTALDVRVQQQVLDLVEEQSRELGLAVLFISHDLAIVAGLAHRVAVMRRGRIVEEGEVDAVFAAPQHPYTRGLLGSIPRLDADPGVRLLTIDEAAESAASEDRGADTEITEATS